MHLMKHLSMFRPNCFYHVWPNLSYSKPTIFSVKCSIVPETTLNSKGKFCQSKDTDLVKTKGFWCLNDRFHIFSVYDHDFSLSVFHLIGELYSSEKQIALFTGRAECFVYKIRPLATLNSRLIANTKCC